MPEGVVNFLTYRDNNIDSFEVNFRVSTFGTLIQQGELDISSPFRTHYYSIVFVTSGEASCLIDCVKTSLKKGDIFVIQVDQLITFMHDNNYEADIISFKHTVFQSQLTEFGKAYDVFLAVAYSAVIDVGEDFNKIIQLKDIIVEESKQDRSLDNVVILSNLLSTLFYMIYRHLTVEQKDRSVNANSNLVNRFLSLVKERVSVKFNVEYFLDKLNVTQTTLQKATKLALIKSPKRIIQDQIIIESKNLLSNKHSRVQDVAFALGFTDPTNFTKYFKKQVGVTPDHFKRLQHDK